MTTEKHWVNFCGCPKCGEYPPSLLQEPYRVCKCGEMLIISSRGEYVPLDGFDPVLHLNEDNALEIARKCGNGTFLDVGANRGQWTLQLKNQFRHIIAVEPHPDNMTTLLALTRNIEHIDLVEAAVSDRDGDGWLQLSDSCWRHMVCAADALERKIPIKLVRLDSLIREDVDLLKMDVEGHELIAVKSVENCRYKIRNWIVECHPGTDKAALQALFKGKYTQSWISTRTENSHLWARL